MRIALLFLAALALIAWLDVAHDTQADAACAVNLGDGWELSARDFGGNKVAALGYNYSQVTGDRIDLSKHGYWMQWESDYYGLAEWNLNIESANDIRWRPMSVEILLSGQPNENYWIWRGRKFRFNGHGDQDMFSVREDERSVRLAPENTGGGDWGSFRLEFQGYKFADGSRPMGNLQMDAQGRLVWTAPGGAETVLAGP